MKALLKSLAVNPSLTDQIMESVEDEVTEIAMAIAWAATQAEKVNNSSPVELSFLDPAGVQRQVERIMADLENNNRKSFDVYRTRQDNKITREQLDKEWNEVVNKLGDEKDSNPWAKKWEDLEVSLVQTTIA